MRRREFITLVGGAAATWPVLARAQQTERVRRVGVILSVAQNDPGGQVRVGTFREELQKLGWAAGRNIHFDYLWTGDDAGKNRTAAKELVDLAPDVILISGQPLFDAMHQTTKTIPIVFVQVTEPFGSGAVASLARPGGNMTGFANDSSVGGKWLQILKEIAPSVRETAIIFHPEDFSNLANLRAIEAALPASEMQLSQIPARNSADISVVLPRSRTSRMAVWLCWQIPQTT